VGSNVISIGIDQLPAELARLEGRMGKALVRGLRVGAERGRAIMVKRTPTDRGELRASWKVRANGLATELVNDAPHAGIVELGARPHKVSAEGWAAIYEWVRRHPFLYGQKRARTKVSATPTQVAAMGPFKGLDPEISSITWAIVKKINKVGQKATYFVLKSMDELRDTLAKEIERQIERVAAQAGAKGGA
jgi:hypothetical protein